MFNPSRRAFALGLPATAVGTSAVPERVTHGSTLPPAPAAAASAARNEAPGPTI